MTYIGTKLEHADAREFGVKAAEQGLSKAALMRKLAIQFLESQASKAAARKRAKSKVA